MAYLPTVKQLQCFVAVAEELNFRRAADRLCMSQPPLTRQIQNLEELVGVALLDRGSKKVALSAAGQAFLGRCRHILTELESAVASVQHFLPPQPMRFVLGVTTVLDIGVMPDFAAVLAEALPGAAIETMRTISIELMELMRLDRIDLAIIGLPSPVPDIVVAEVIHSEPLMVALSARHPAAACDHIDLRNLAQDRLFWFSRKLNPAFYDYCAEVFQAIGYHPERIPEPRDLHILLGLIARQEGIALMPASLQAVRREDIVYRSLIPDQERVLKIDLALAYKRGSAVAGQQAVFSAIRNSFRRNGRNDGRG